MKVSGVALALTLLIPAASRAQAPGVFSASIAPGENFDKADFALWLPPGGAVQAIAILMPGSNGDGRAQVSDTAWQAFAIRNRVALVGARLTDKPHDQSFIEDYVNVPRGSGQALLDVLGNFATTTKHPELATAPLLLWGMSAGGEFNFEFVNWKPERVAAFVVNKGGIYYTALASRGARNVPGILFTGGKDLESRVNVINGLFAVNRRGAALWAVAQEPGVGHVVGRSRDVAIVFYEDVLAARVDPANPATMRAMVDRNGFIGDTKAQTFRAIGAAQVSTEGTSWLPTERTARAWQAMISEHPFQP